MSVWRRDIFKWPRRSQSAKPNTTKVRDPIVTIGNLDDTVDAVAKDLHSAAIHGRQRDITRHLESGICIDFPNDAGQTPLFCASMRGHSRAVEVLLQNGANPNEKDNKGMTPVHAACLRGSLRMLGAMIEYGGDLRLHDNDGNTCIDWAKRQPDPRRRLKMLEFLQKSQLFALSYSGDVSKAGVSLDRQPSILQMLRSKVGSHVSLDIGTDTGLKRVRSHGFGKVYYGGDSDGGILSVIPLITENLLIHDDSGVSFDSTSHMRMESMRWDKTPVTVKESSQMLHREYTVDLLISELERLSKLRHPNILLLMGLCQSTNLDNLMLVFERVSVGSLHHLLYDKMERLPMMTVRDIARQVCEAMLYIHHQNFMHCGLSSHAVYLVSVYQAKVGSFEYMVERKKAEVGRSSIVSMSQHRDQLYRWMAPEVLMGQPPTTASDIYSFCCILWEMVTTELPWKSMKLEEVAKTLKSRKGQLSTNNYKMPGLFRGTLDIGLKVQPTERPNDFTAIQQWLLGPIDKAPGWKANSLDRLVTLQRESEERIRFSGNYTPNDYAGSDSDTSRKIPKSESQEKEQSKIFDKPTSTHLKAQSDRTSNAGSDRSSRATNDTNNHYPLVASGARFDSLHGSWSSLGGSESDDLDSACLKKSTERKEEQRRYWRELSNEFRLSRDKLPKRQDPLSQSEISGLFLSGSDLSKHHRRHANLPWQGSRSLLRAGNTSPRLRRMSKSSRGKNTNLDVSAHEGDCRTLPPVKPASHSTDVKSFERSGSKKSTKALLTKNSNSKLKSKSLERSGPKTGHSPRSPRRTISRPRSENDEIDQLNPVDLELKHQGSVRSLAEQFQTRVYHHNIRQSIIRGSMNPKGLCQEGARLSPDQRLAKLNENSMEESMDEKKREEDELDTGSNKGSAGSLTTVSARDSMTDEDLNEDCKDTEPEVYTSRSHVTDEDAMSMPMPMSDKSAGNDHSQSTSGGEFQTACSDNNAMLGGAVMEPSLQEYVHVRKTTHDRERAVRDSASSKHQSPCHSRDELSQRHSSNDFSHRLDRVDDPPRHNRRDRSSRHSRGEFSPRHAGDEDLLPHHSRQDHSSHHTNDYLTRRHKDGRASRTSDEFSPRHTRNRDDRNSPRHNRSGRASCHARIDEFSPRNNTHDSSPRHSNDDLSPRNTRDKASPRHTSERHSSHHMDGRTSRFGHREGSSSYHSHRDGRSSRHSNRNERSPRHTRGDASPCYIESDISPRHIRGEVSPRHFGSDISPSRTRDKQPSHHTRGDYRRDDRSHHHAQNNQSRGYASDDLSRHGHTRDDLSPRHATDDLSPHCNRRDKRLPHNRKPDYSKDDHAPRHSRDGRSPRDNRRDHSRDDRSPSHTKEELTIRHTRNNESSRHSGNEDSPGHAITEASASHFRNDALFRHARNDVLPIHAQNASYPTHGSDDLSPRDVTLKMSPRKRDGPSPHHIQNGRPVRKHRDARRSRSNEETFDFEEYYIDDDYTAAGCEEDPEKFASLCTQEPPKEVHISSSSQMELRDIQYNEKEKQPQTSNTIYLLSQTNSERREGQESVYPDEDEKLREECELQSASDTVDNLQETTRFTSQRCIMLNLERSGSDLDLPKQQQKGNDEDLEKHSTRALQCDEVDDSTADGVQQLEEHTLQQYTSPPRQSTLHKFYLGPDTCLSGYTTTLRVESSLENPGEHHITHTATDGETGVTHTVHEEKVTNATTLRTTLGVQ